MKSVESFISSENSRLSIQNLSVADEKSRSFFSSERRNKELFQDKMSSKQ